jgi:2-aminomuconate deaminase
MSQSFESSRAPEPVGAFPHAKRVGNLLFLSGIGPRVRGSKEIPGVTLDADGKIQSYDIETQCRAVFPIYNKLYAEYFAGEGKPNPTRTTVEVTALPTPIAIELKVLASLK